MKTPYLLLVLGVVGIAFVAMNCEVQASDATSAVINLVLDSKSREAAISDIKSLLAKVEKEKSSFVDASLKDKVGSLLGKLKSGDAVTDEAEGLIQQVLPDFKKSDVIDAGFVSQLQGLYDNLNNGSYFSSNFVSEGKSILSTLQKADFTSVDQKKVEDFVNNFNSGKYVSSAVKSQVDTFVKQMQKGDFLSEGFKKALSSVNVSEAKVKSVVDQIKKTGILSSDFASEANEVLNQVQKSDVFKSLSSDVTKLFKTAKDAAVSAAEDKAAALKAKADQGSSDGKSAGYADGAAGKSMQPNTDMGATDETKAYRVAYLAGYAQGYAGGIGEYLTGKSSDFQNGYSDGYAAGSKKDDFNVPSGASDEYKVAYNLGYFNGKY